MKTALLIADLEGITGVDTLESLVLAGEGNVEATLLMNQEVSFVAQKLLSVGFDSIRISDAHRSGAPHNIDVSLFPDGCEAHVLDDMYGGPLLAGVDVVACVGMHASGTSPGFGAHTVSVHTAWALGGRELSETAVVQLLAGERGIPVWFSAGDQILESELGTLPFVRTKNTTSRDTTRSRKGSDVQRDFIQVLQRDIPSPIAAPRANLTIRFQRHAEAQAAFAAGAIPASANSIVIQPRDSFQAQYEEALRFISATERAVLSRVQGAPGTAAFARSAIALFNESWD
jgi:D-aminopeptidase